MIEADPMTAERFAKVRSGRTRKGAVETLYRTAEGRWVRKVAWHVAMGRWVEDEASPALKHRPLYWFCSDAEAMDWLNQNGYADRVERYFGDDLAERGPGRPEVGGRVQVRLGELLGDVDGYAASEGCSRAEAIRRLVLAGLSCQPGSTASV